MTVPFLSQGRLVTEVSPGLNLCLSLNYEGSKLTKLLTILIFYAISKGKTEELDEGKSAKAIKRVFVEPQTVRRMTEPDFDKPKPKWCDDILILYATKAEADYKPLTQTAIDLSAGLSTRGHNPPDVRFFFLPSNSRKVSVIKSHVYGKRKT